MSGDSPHRPGPRPRRDPNWPSSPIVRILIVCDDEFSYATDERFGLTELIGALEAPSLFVSFALTKAHRETSPYSEQADVQSFRFDNAEHFNASNFDEIWFFGLRHTNETVSKLSDAELRIVSEFMDRGGGVFAAGDHEDLGSSLCGQIPRVRSMRKWHFDYQVVAEDYENYDPASGDSPPVLGSFRHDTLMAGEDPSFTFDDQSDDLAAEIIPKYYGTSNKYLVYKYPHPLLCGPRGVIAILPDHMHEGECIVPTDVGQSTTFNGYTSAEYPTVDGAQPVPDVVAEGIVTAHQTDNTGEDSIVDVASKAKTFGCIGAYDGHTANVGRVVVDSTFHHFVNININGTASDSMDPVKQEGFYASAEGLEQYERIQAYWRNIAIWLAPPGAARNMFYTALWAARWDSQIRMLTPGLVQKRGNWRNTVAYGTAVHAVMKRFWSPCAVVDWVFAQDNPLAKFKWWLVLTLPDPPPWKRLIVDLPELATGMLGEMMAHLVAAVPERDDEFRDSLAEKMPKIVKESYQSALRSAAREAQQKAEATKKFFDSVQA